MLLIPFLGFTQEQLIPLNINPYLQDRIETRAGHGIDSTFIYNYSNLSLPVFDDFSTNKWVKYMADFTGGNVTSNLYYYLLNEQTLIPISPSQTLCDSLGAYHDTIYVNDDTLTSFSRHFFTTGFGVMVNNLNQFPISSNTVELFTECYTIIDSVIDGVLNPSQDTVFKSPNYTQDSARVFMADISSTDIWVDDHACHNYTYAISPKSLGVATLDGVNNQGYPYEFGNANSYGVADYLTSKPVDLFGKTNVFLSFLYQPKGNGNSPEANDSIILEMYSPTLDTWYNMWSVSGDEPDNEWGMAHVEITATALLQNGFQFRFKNKASLSANLDHWHIDYVNLRENSSVDDTIINDLAIVYPINSLLKDYTAVPWDHYNNLNNPSDKMVSNYELLVMNNDQTAKLTNSGHLNIDGTNFTLPVSSPNWNVGENVYPFNVGSQPYSFAQNSGIDKAEFDVKMNIATSSVNLITENDTTYFTQEFKNYYAYDDGTAESGYGLLDFNAKLAVKFEAYEADTLTGVLMKFVPNVSDVTGNIFLLTIWGDDDGVPGDIIYQDDIFSPHFPNYAAQKKQFSYYTFNNKQSVVVPEIFYVGWEQIEEENLYLGFDKNSNNQNNNFYDIGGGWTNSSLEGALIMRPVFSTKLNYTLGIKPVLPEQSVFNMYPNPVSNQLYIDGLNNDNSIQITDISGKVIFSSSNSNTIDFNYLNSGFYIVSVLDKKQNIIYSNKIIKP